VGYSLAELTQGVMGHDWSPSVSHLVHEADHFVGTKLVPGCVWYHWKAYDLYVVEMHDSKQNRVAEAFN